MLENALDKAKYKTKVAATACLASTLLFFSCTPELSKFEPKNKPAFELCLYEKDSSASFSKGFYEQVLQTSADFLSTNGLTTAVVDYEESNNCNPVVFEEPINYIRALNQADKDFMQTKDSYEFFSTQNLISEELEGIDFLVAAYNLAHSRWNKLSEPSNVSEANQLVESFIFENVNDSLEDMTDNQTDEAYHKVRRLNQMINTLGFQGSERSETGITHINLLANLLEFKEFYSDGFNISLLQAFDSHQSALIDQLAKVTTHEFLHGLYLEHTHYSKNPNGSPLSPCPEENNIMTAVQGPWPPLQDSGISSFQVGAALYFNDHEEGLPFPYSRPVYEFIKEQSVPRSTYECNENEAREPMEMRR